MQARDQVQRTAPKVPNANSLGLKKVLRHMSSIEAHVWVLLLGINIIYQVQRA